MNDDHTKDFFPCKKDDLIVITGAGGFIAGALTRYFHERGLTRIRSTKSVEPTEIRFIRLKRTWPDGGRGF
jgi:hypothetical protein